MDSATCNVIYVDRNARGDKFISSSDRDSEEVQSQNGLTEFDSNLKLLLDAFGDVHVCASGASCITQLFNLHNTSMVELKPTLVLINTPSDEQRLDSGSPSRDPSPHSKVSDDTEDRQREADNELYGIKLLDRVVYEARSRNLAKLVVPIPVVSFPLLQSPRLNGSTQETDSKPSYAKYLTESADPSSKLLTNRALVRKCLDSGAVDVMASPLHMKVLTTLEVHAYRAHKEAAREQQAALEIRRGRKRSWVGIHDEKPFSYLREAMVSGLMSGICRMGGDNEDSIEKIKISIPSRRRAEISEAVGKWHFSAHSFSDDELVVAASAMFKHALSMPELERWRISSDQLSKFLVACRAAYNCFVPYHNFRHAVDVLQATFHFLVQLNVLPPYPAKEDTPRTPTAKSPMASLLKPFEALTLLVSAIGHDVGHPGVNNGFLVTLNAPLAQLYNDRSVLESFHCAAYSQILRRYWPQAFEDTKMRNLMISTILATDMGLHFDYMKKLGDLQAKLQENNSTDGWNGRMLEEQTAFACSLLIKCADISNVARNYETALQWMWILCDEFSRQASMENEIGIPSALISPPKKEFMALGKSQLGFMNMFAIPLFQGVADVLPGMQYTVDELEINKVQFEKTLEEIPAMDEERKQRLLSGALSPRTLSLAVQPPKTQNFPFPSETEQSLKIPLPENHAEMKNAGSSMPEQTYTIPDLPGHYKEINGTHFDAVDEFAASDPFHIHDGENETVGHHGKQRRSETTDGSASAPCSGDWASQATSATTGKMPLSPSTQGTSIISTESIERPPSAPVATLPFGADSWKVMAPPIATVEHPNPEDEFNGSTPKPDKSLKKKGSRFRMNALNIFRRNKGTNSPSSNGEWGGVNVG